MPLNFNLSIPEAFDLSYIQRLHEDWMASVEDEGRIAQGIGPTPQAAIDAAIAQAQAIPPAVMSLQSSPEADDLLRDLGLTKPRTIHRRV